jgi:glycosyltransferase involved in cell wall biosynthesis
VREKGLQVLLAAWRASGLGAPGAALVLVGMGSLPPWVPADGAAVLSEAQPGPDRTLDVDFGLHNAASVTTVGAVEPVELRNFYAAAHVLVMPSVRTPTFREPWGLVANEAMNQGLPVIASDAVGAAAGGLIRNEGNGLVVPAGQAQALADAMRRLAADGDLRQRLGAAGARDVLAYTPSAWAEGFASALASVGAGVGQPFAGAR